MKEQSIQLAGSTISFEYTTFNPKEDTRRQNLSKPWYNQREFAELIFKHKTINKNKKHESRIKKHL